MSPTVIDKGMLSPSQVDPRNELSNPKPRNKVKLVNPKVINKYNKTTY